MSKSVARLYTNFHPEHYDLKITLLEDKMHFSGSVVITGRKVGRPSKRLTFHTNGVKVTSGKITVRGKKGETEAVLTRINHHKSLHEVRLHTESILYPNEYVVEMTFEAPITRGMTGIYPCFFQDGDTEKNLFATQFESHHAREAFPCIDEPEAKATFELTLTTNDGVEVLSNTPIAEQKHIQQGGSDDTSASDAHSQRLETRFETTPRMSTYLLAFVCGEMIHASAKTASGVAVNTWATTAQPKSSLDFALDAAVKSIEYFEDYFGVPYPLTKSDHVALPDFSSGAMENWGLITYRERVLLAYEGDTGQSTREQIALVVAHETSHQWFGNLVTMQWWNDLWLNESFANMMEYQCVDSFYPEWKVWQTFIGSEGLSAFRRDAIYGVQSVRTEVHHPDEISSLFDPSIVYAKGGRLLYMLKNYIGDEAFRRGLTAYFKKHAYSNTTGDDLWEALSEASGKNIASFMTPWLTRAGFPVISVGQTDDELTLLQQQFLDDTSKVDETIVWPTPLFSSQVKDTDMISTSQVKFAAKDTDPVLLNQGYAGHYLVRYLSPRTNAFLKDQISSRELPEVDRLMHLNAASMFAKAGYISFASVLELLTAYAHETSEPVWDIMGLITGEARRFVELDESIEMQLKAFCGTLAAKELERLGWDERPGESAADQKLRGLVLGLGLYAENEKLTREATDKFAQFMAGTLKLPAELRGLIMVVPVKNGDNAAFEYLLDLHDKTQNSDMKNDIADALTATRSQKHATLLLNRLTNPKLVKPQDADRWLVYMLRNRYTKATAWQWMVDNWAWLEETYKHDKSYDYLPRYAASCVNTSEYAAKFHDLFDSKASQPLLTRNIELGSEEIATRVAWLERDLVGVQDFFKAVQ